ncbi:hypothetical protein SDC9_206898 [bioreactor metagenome]|uniref:Uncharacterized protein n=1 Tax=bioreactor metagenome TaxID=1076179 RepID=A0A645J6A0_9ZZZZ
MISAAELDLVLAGYTFCAVMEQSCHQRLINVRVVAHCHGRGSIHDAQGMLITLFVQFRHQLTAYSGYLLIHMLPFLSYR